MLEYTHTHTPEKKVQRLEKIEGVTIKAFLNTFQYRFEMLSANMIVSATLKWKNVTMAKTARPCVYTLSGERRRQICPRYSNLFHFYKCIQKVTILLLCSSFPHFNLIITILCKTWDSERPARQKTEGDCNILKWSHWESSWVHLSFIFIQSFHLACIYTIIYIA